MSHETELARATKGLVLGETVTTGPKDPTQEELVAITTAIEMSWPKHTVEEDIRKEAQDAWKFANRWWQGSHLMRRGRPGRR